MFPQAISKLLLSITKNVFFVIAFSLIAAGTIRVSHAVCHKPNGQSASPGSTTASITWNNVSGASGYIVHYKISSASSYSTATTSVASIVLTGLLPSTTYNYRLQTNCGSGGFSQLGSTNSFTTASSCNAPSGLTSSSVTASGATITWSAVSGAASYNIQYQIAGSGSWLSTTSTTTSKSLTSLSPGKNYEWKVQGVCSGGAGAWSAVSSFTTLCASVSVLSTTSVTTTSALLTWSSAVCDSFLVRYYVTSIPGTVYYKNVKPGSATSTTITGLQSNTNYSWLIRTYCNGGSSGPYSATLTFTTLAECPVATGLTVSNRTPTSAKTAWSFVSGASYYNVRYKISTSSTWISTSSTTNTKSLSGLTPNSMYQFQVQVVCSSGTGAWSTTGTFVTPPAGFIPAPDHIVIVIEENRAYEQIIGNSAAPFINALAIDPMSASFTQSYAHTHPSQPNYIYFISGENQGVTNNNTPVAHFTTPNLAASLIAAGKTFATYSQGLPSIGYDGSAYGAYVRKHNPVTNWMGTGPNQVSPSCNLPFTSFPTDFNQLPTVSFVIPDLNNDMHDGTISQGDTWLANNLSNYIQWAKSHNSLFMLIYDEDDGLYGNHIVTIYTGPMVIGGQYSQPITLVSQLRTIEAMYGLPNAGSYVANPITGCWQLPRHAASQSSDNRQQQTELHVFPNPFRKEINLTYKLEKKSDVKLEVYDASGRMVKAYDEIPQEQESGDYHYTFVAPSKGIYFIHFIVDGNVYVKRIACSD